MIKFAALPALGALAASASLATAQVNLDAFISGEAAGTPSPAFGVLDGYLTVDEETDETVYIWAYAFADADFVSLIGDPVAPVGFYLDWTPEGGGTLLHTLVSAADGELSESWPDMAAGGWLVREQEQQYLLDERVWVVFSTDAFPGGEVAGQIVPAPGVGAALGVAGLAAFRRRRR